MSINDLLSKVKKKVNLLKVNVIESVEDQFLIQDQSSCAILQVDKDSKKYIEVGKGKLNIFVKGFKWF